jgi:hypothetical protein
VPFIGKQGPAELEERTRKNFERASAVEQVAKQFIQMAAASMESRKSQ